MNISDKLRDPNLSEEEQDAIFGAFVRQRENSRLKARWTNKLATEHNVVRSAPAAAPPKKERAVVRKLIFTVMAIASCALLLFLALPLLSPASGSDLLAENIERITLDVSRGGADGDLAALRQSLTANFQAGDYSAALTTAATIAAAPTAEPADRLQYGLLALKAADYPLAVRQFRQLLDKPGNYTAEGHFYLGLALLAQGDVDAGQQELRKISTDDGSKLHDAATRLLQQKW